MKAWYVLKPDIANLDDIVRECDTLLVNGFALDGGVNGRYPTRDELEGISDKYRPLGIKVVPVLIWADGDRKFVPGDMNYVNSKIDEARRLFITGRYDGIVFDIEGYFRELFGNPWNDTDEMTSEWREMADLMRDALDFPITGQMPYKTMQAISCWPDGFYHFLESTYGGIKFWDTVKLTVQDIWYRCLYGIRRTYVPGLWKETFTPEEFERQKELAVRYYGGYWIYSDAKDKKK